MSKRNLKIMLLILTILLISCILILLLKKDLKLELKGQSNISININDEYKDAKVTACYGNVFKCKKISYLTKGHVNNNKIGEYKIIYQVNYKHKTKKVSRTIKVVDKEAPKLNIITKEFYVCPNGKLDNYSYEAIDNYDGNITDKVKTEIKYNKLLFTVIDSSKNIMQKSFSFEKADKTPPIINLKGQESLFITLNSQYLEEGYIAMDNCDEDLTDKVRIIGDVDTSKPGVYNLTYEVTDLAGNKTKANRKITVYEKNNIVNPSAKTVYLTFDDGPGEHTGRLLDILKKHNVKATFFVTNQYPQYEDMITRAYNEGHTIALHTYTHNYAFVYSSVENYFNDLQNIKDKVKRLTNGYEAQLVRFPGGSSNTVSRRYSPGIMTTLANELQERGFKYIDWNIVSGDAGETKSTEQIINNVTSNLKDNYSIVLQHDVKGYSVDAVEAIIEYAKANGYNFAPMDITSPDAHQHINN